MVATETRGLFVWQFRQHRTHGGDVALRNSEREQVRVGEVAVVVRFFLRAHGARFVARGVVQACFLHHLATRFDQFDLTTDFVLDGLFHETEGVDVLELRTRAELFLAHGAHGNVGVAAEGTFLHVAVANLQVPHERVDFLEIGHGFFRGAHVRLGDNFQQRRAGTVQVDTAERAQALVHALAGVFFEMRASNADDLRAAIFEEDGHGAVLNHRQLVLADLVALGQVRVEVVLAGKHRTGRNGGAYSQAETNSHADGFAVQDRQHAGVAQVNEVRLAVRRGAVSRRRRGENLRLRGQLGVDFQPDDHFPFAPGEGALYVFSHGAPLTRTPPASGGASRWLAGRRVPPTASAIPRNAGQ